MNVIEKQSTGSTNNDAKQLADDGAPSFTVVWAHTQNAGRGRYNREWTSIEGNVFWSVILRPDGAWRRFSDIVYVNALAVWQTLSETCGPTASFELKWPNDVLTGERKVAGCLLESGGLWKDRAPGWIVIGVGINVNSHPDTPGLQYPATDLHAAGYREVTREQLVGTLTRKLEHQIDIWKDRGFDDLRKRYLERAFRLGCKITIGLSTNKQDYVTGIYAGVDDEGCIMLDANGKIVKFASAEVVLPTS